MDIILQSNQFTPAQIRMLNYCRLYLGAVTLADLTIPNGVALDQAKLKGHISHYSNITRWLKIRQDRSSETQWRLWRRANLLWSTRNGRLFQPLGNWLRTNDERRIMCPAYAYESHVAIRVHNEYQEIYEVDATGRQVGNTHVASVRYEDLHPSAAPADVYEAPDGQWTLRMRTQVNDPAPTPTYTSFAGYTTILQPWEADLLQHVSLAIDPAYICYDLQHYFYAGTDGSVMFETDGGAFRWVLSNTEG